MTDGALVISLDFELLWGVFDRVYRNHPYCANLQATRQVVPRLLDLFKRYQIHATWATVGLLFATTRSEQLQYWPRYKPQYQNRLLQPDLIDVGLDEGADPICYASTLLRRIKETPGQEIGSHTYTHFYADEPGQDLEHFRADLAAAVSIAEAEGFKLQSLVFPRNQVRQDYLQVLSEAGFRCYRGNEPNFGYQKVRSRFERWLQRGYRLLDTYVNISGDNSSSWDMLFRQEQSCVNVPASRFLRPCTGPLLVRRCHRLHQRRIERALLNAARQNHVFHLWWHPHNFGNHTEENLERLESLLRFFANLRRDYGMASLSMAEVASRVQGKVQS